MQFGRQESDSEQDRLLPIDLTELYGAGEGAAASDDHSAFPASLQPDAPPLTVKADDFPHLSALQAQTGSSAEHYRTLDSERNSTYHSGHFSGQGAGAPDRRSMPSRNEQADPLNPHRPIKDKSDALREITLAIDNLNQLSNSGKVANAKLKRLQIFRNNVEALKQELEEYYERNERRIQRGNSGKQAARKQKLFDEIHKISRNTLSITNQLMRGSLYEQQGQLNHFKEQCDVKDHGLAAKIAAVVIVGTLIIAGGITGALLGGLAGALLPPSSSATAFGGFVTGCVMGWATGLNLAAQIGVTAGAAAAAGIPTGLAAAGFFRRGGLTKRKYDVAKSYDKLVHTKPISGLQ